VAFARNAPIRGGSPRRWILSVMVAAPIVLAACGRRRAPSPSASTTATSAVAPAPPMSASELFELFFHAPELKLEAKCRGRLEGATRSLAEEREQCLFLLEASIASGRVAFGRERGERCAQEISDTFMAGDPARSLLDFSIHPSCKGLIEGVVDEGGECRSAL